MRCGRARASRRTQRAACRPRAHRRLNHCRNACDSRADGFAAAAKGTCAHAPAQHAQQQRPYARVCSCQRARRRRVRPARAARHRCAGALLADALRRGVALTRAAPQAPPRAPPRAAAPPLRASPPAARALRRCTPALRTALPARRAARHAAMATAAAAASASPVTVTPEWLAQNLGRSDLKARAMPHTQTQTHNATCADATLRQVLDCSWYMPAAARDAAAEYAAARVPGAVFFDLARGALRSRRASATRTPNPRLLTTRALRSALCALRSRSYAISRTE